MSSGLTLGANASIEILSLGQQKGGRVEALNVLDSKGSDMAPGQ